MRKYGRIAFITTPKFRESRQDEARRFIYANLYPICANFRVVVTGRTGRFVRAALNRRLSAEDVACVRESMDVAKLGRHDLQRWRNTIIDGLEETRDGLEGMIHVTHDLVEGRMDAVIHLTDWADRTAKADSATLARAANVYNVPIASDPHTAVAYVREWRRRMLNGERVFMAREQPAPPPLDGLQKGDRILAIIAHDNRKVDTCLFAVEHARYIYEHYDYILATGTTGRLLREFMRAIGRGAADVNRIHCCKSGPLGGDVQIAYAIVTGLCQKAIFFQDPSVSHAHAADISLFEQAVVAPSMRVQLATNAESARLLIFAPGIPDSPTPVNKPLEAA